MNLKAEARKLRAGKTVTFTVQGASMVPKILPGASVTVEPVDPASVKRGDIVLAKVKGRLYLHLVSSTDKHRVQISNNHKHVNGWTPRDHVYGRLVKN